MAILSSTVVNGTLSVTNEILLNGEQLKANTVNTTGNQTITGEKTFNSTIDNIDISRNIKNMWPYYLRGVYEFTSSSQRETIDLSTISLIVATSDLRFYSSTSASSGFSAKCLNYNGTVTSISQAQARGGHFIHTYPGSSAAGTAQIIKYLFDASRIDSLSPVVVVGAASNYLVVGAPFASTSVPVTLYAYSYRS